MSDGTKGLLIRLCLGTVMVIVSGILVVGHTLFVVDSEEIGYAPPPEYVSSGTMAIESSFFSNLSLLTDATTIVEDEEDIPVSEAETPPSDTPRRGDFSELAREVMDGVEDSATVITLLRSEDQKTRLDVTYALVDAAVDTGLDDRARYWERLGNDGRDTVRQTLREAMVDTVENATWNEIPFFLRQTALPGDSTAELLAWVSRHHPQDLMREDAMNEVLILAPRSALAAQVISERAHDPSMRVRMEVLSIRMGRLFDF